MRQREREETLEAELRATQRDIAESQEQLDDHVSQFQRFQDDAYAFAQHLGVLDPELTREFEHHRQEFLDVKREADRLIDRAREDGEQIRIELETLRGDR